MLMKCINSGSSGNGYALMLRAIDYQTSKVAGCLISHEHG